MSKLVTYNRLIFILSIFGLLVAGYVLNGYLSGSSIYCPAGGGCEAVRKSPYAWPLGIPVPGIGFVGYAVIVLLAFLRTLTPKKNHQLLLGLFGMATFGVVFVTGFTLTEAFLIKNFCTWCVISAINMYVIFGLTLASLRQSRK